ncbi:MAG: hypothetical protein IKM81_01055, partial [Fibrobacter sp.]|nr:hypothetical protein [Fibrobacter sp.]
SSEDGDKVSSSSEKASDNSSSSTKDGSTSSSSEAPESSSSEEAAPVETPIGTRVAELVDLEKNMELKLFDITVYLSTGSKKGLMALRIPDELWAVTYTDFANGSVTFKMDDVGLLYSETDAAKTIVEMMNEGIKISFAFDELDGKILYSLNDWDGYTDAVKASVAVQKGKVSKAEVIQNKIYACADGDSTKTFKFLESSYTYEVSVDNNVVDWHAGHYDIQRSSLLMRPLRDAETSRSLYIYSVGEDNTITADNGEVMNCTVDDAENDDDL